MRLKTTPFLFILGISIASASTYYVAPNGNDNANGDLNNPLQSFSKAQSVALAGDTIFFRGGVYSYTTTTTACTSQTAVVASNDVNKSGSANNLIHYFAYPNETPIFDFYGVTADCRIQGFYVTASYVHFKGFEIRGVPQNNNKNHENWGVRITGSNNIFELLNIHHISGAGLFLLKGSNNLILNSDSHHNYDPLTSNGAGESADGFGAHVRSSDTGNIFRGCRAWWNTDDGYDLINAFAPVVIEDSWAWLNGYLPDTKTAASNGNGFKAGGYGLDTTRFPSYPVPHKVQRSVSFYNRSAGFYANHHTSDVLFYNNTSYANHPNYNMLGITKSGGDTTVGIYRNNISYVNTHLTNNTHSTANDAYNSWTLNVSLSNNDFVSVDTTGISGPRQSDGSLPDLNFLKLVSNSDLIDKGIDLSMVYAGAAPDLGAYEKNLPSSSSAPSSSAEEISSSSEIIVSSYKKTDTFAPYSIQRCGDHLCLQSNSGTLQFIQFNSKGEKLRAFSLSKNDGWIQIEPQGYLKLKK